MLRNEWFTNVEQSMIDMAPYNMGEACPIAMSVHEFMKRVNGQAIHYPDSNYVVVGYDSIVLQFAGEEPVIHDNMPSLRRWIIAFESDRKLVEPIKVGFINEGNGYPIAYVKGELK